jgi:ADP-ribose pyrophosphatase YjhB (NUDIX family)
MFEPSYCPRCAGRLVVSDVEGRSRPVCDDCRFVYYIDPKVAVAVIVPFGDGIVLGRRAIDPGRGAWSFPSGYVDRGEVVEEAARREVQEEVGLQVAIDGLVGLYSTAGEPVILAVFAARVTGGELEVGPEMSEVAVYPPDELPPMAFSHDQRIVADWRCFLDRLARSER